MAAQDVVVALDVSRKTFRTIVANFVAAYGYNTLALPLAAGALFPLTGTLMPPWVASLAMALSSVTVVTNSLALRWWYRRCAAYHHIHCLLVLCVSCFCCVLWSEGAPGLAALRWPPGWTAWLWHTLRSRSRSNLLALRWWHQRCAACHDLLPCCVLSLVLMGWLPLHLPPWGAGLAMAMSSVMVVTNSLALRWWRQRCAACHHLLLLSCTVVGVTGWLPCN
jgi:hypothetical protein